MISADSTRVVGELRIGISTTSPVPMGNRVNLGRLQTNNFLRRGGGISTTSPVPMGNRVNLGKLASDYVSLL